MRTSNNGQLMIIVALGMVAFLGFAALAIDLGRGYSERRNAQNGADAAALAGMRLVRAQPALSGTQILANIRAVAAQNGGAQIPSDTDALALDQNKNVIGNLSAQAGNDYDLVYSLRVKTTIQYSTFFAGVLGFAQLSSSGLATAMSEDVKPMVLPLGFHVQGTGCAAPWGFDTTTTYRFYDTIPNSPGGFGFLDFTGSGASASVTGDWVKNGYTGDYFAWTNYKWDPPPSAQTPPFGGWGWDNAARWYTATTPSPDPGKCDGYYADGAGGSFDWTDAGTWHSPPKPPASWGVPPPNMPPAGQYDMQQGAGMGTYSNNYPISSLPQIFWMNGNSGVGNSSTVQDVFMSAVGHQVIILIYNRVSGSGANARFQIVGMAGFNVTGASMTGNPKYMEGTFGSVVQGGPSNGMPCNGDKCTVRLVRN